MVLHGLFAALTLAGLGGYEYETKTVSARGTTASSNAKIVMKQTKRTYFGSQPVYEVRVTYDGGSDALVKPGALDKASESLNLLSKRLLCRFGSVTSSRTQNFYKCSRNEMDLAAELKQWQQLSANSDKTSMKHRETSGYSVLPF